MVNNKRVAPERGDIIYVDFTEAGRELKDRHPAFVISASSYNSKVGLAIVCPITSKAKGYPFEVIIPARYSVTGVILVDQIKSIDWRARNAEYECHLPDKIIKKVLDKLSTLLWE